MDGTYPWVEDVVLHDGAEARTISGEWFGTNAVMKIRRPKGYRHPSLDQSLTKRRLYAEARILHHLSRAQSFQSSQSALHGYQAKQRRTRSIYNVYVRQGRTECNQ